MFTSDYVTNHQKKLQINLWLVFQSKIQNSLYYPSCTPFEFTLRKTEATLRPHIEFYV